MMADIKRKVPNLRFKGFTDDWEQRKLGDLFVYNRPDKYMVQDTNYIDSGTPVLTANKSFVLGYTNENHTYNKLPAIIFDDFTLENKFVKFPFMVKSSAIKILNSRNDQPMMFMYQLLQHSRFVHEGHSRHYISIVQRKDVMVPDNVEEQKKIATLFSRIQNIITLQQRKLDLLKQLKKGFLQKMFADQDRKQPVLRFNGFSGDWDEVKLSDNSKIFIGLVTSMTKHYAKNGTFLVRNSDISENFISHHKPIYLDSKFAEKNNNRRMRTNDVVTVHTGNIGTSAVISEKENGAIGFATIVTRPDRNVWNALFLSDYLNTSKHKKWAIRMATGDGRNNYNLRDFIRIRVPNPGIDEQKKVSKFVQLIENNISDQQQKIRNLETLKKSLLQQMFI
jgi:type I restriction enzyme S subunit